MKNIFVVFVLLLFSGTIASAYELSITEVEKPYDEVPVVLDKNIQKVHLGVLQDFPLMYEVEVEATTTLALKLSQQYRDPSDATPFSLMIVRKNDDGGGVTEVARFYPESEDWKVKKDSELGLTFLVSKKVSNIIAPGTYNVEVSTPENIGKFSLTFGDTDNAAGYFERLGQTWTTQKFFGYSVLKMLSSSLIYFPLGIIFILFIISRFLKYKKVISNVN